jgi:iron uptake system component EfeO
MNTPFQFTRRQFMKNATLASAAALLPVHALLHAENKTPTTELQHQESDSLYSDQVDAGLAYFKKQAAIQIPLVEAMLKAIRDRSLTKARQAYIDARPPYEEIEVLAPCFPQTDLDIDARPYMFEDGITDKAFKGFHRIEMLIFGGDELEAAEPYAAELIESCKTLQKDLENRSAFSAKSTFEGLAALANEVAAKKISSEEETWSDQSLVIFKHNWIAIYSQYEPFHSIVSKKNEKVAQGVIDAYKKAMALIEPHFKKGVVAGTPYSKIGMAERYRIVKASTALRDALIKAAETLELI